MPAHYIYLFIAVVLETFGTACLKYSNEFSRLLPSIGVIIGFAGALYFLTLTIRTMPIGVVYAIWSGLGIIFITLIGLFFFKQSLDAAAYIGMGFIIIGVVIMNIFSNSNTH